MTVRNRSTNLTADLLHDLEADETPPTLAVAPAATRTGSAGAVESAPFVEAALYLAPRDWRRPTVARTGRSLSLSGGPLRLRIGRRPR